MRFYAVVPPIVLLTLHRASARGQCRDKTPIPDPSHPSADVLASVQQTLNLFPIAIDNKNFSILNQVFTTDAFAAFQPDQPQYSLQNITGWLELFLSNVTSHHSLGGLYVTQENPCEATAISYLQGSFFGRGPATGQMYQSFGYYQDQLFKNGGIGSDSWLVVNRTLHGIVSTSPFATPLRKAAYYACCVKRRRLN